MWRSELRVLVLVEPERHLRAADQDRPADQIRILHHQIDRFLLRLRQRPLLPDRTARAHEIEEAAGVDVLLEKLAGRRFLVDVDFLHLDPVCVQKTSGVLASGSGGLGVKRELRHRRTIVKHTKITEIAEITEEKMCSAFSAPSAVTFRMLTINEIFYSIQGESTKAGQPCVFVRLTACDLRCTWCDTPYAFHEGRKMSIDEVLDAVDRHACPLVEITGGEPLLQDDVYPLMDRLLERGRTVMLETGGHRPIDRVPADVRKIVDVKCPASGEANKNDWKNLDRLAPHDQIGRASCRERG